MLWQTKLIRWYKKHHRDLPWRRSPTPYRILVSEIMLQQTTVKTVIPYYRRFLKKFPSLRSLARASEEEVLTIWSGLGYYSRARNLHKAAQICLQDYSGCIPRHVETLKSLPGIGTYTAGAVTSIAFDERAPIVDGNVARVIARLFCVAEDPRSHDGMKAFWDKSEETLPQSSVGDFNQALMELGSLVCTPTQPACAVCPIQRDCQAFQSGHVSAFPKITRRVKYQKIRLSAAIIQRDSSYLMIRRPQNGALRGMWEFPMVEGDLTKLVATFGLKRSRSIVLKTISHSIMNRRLTIQPWLFRTPSSLPRIQKSQWLNPKEIQKRPTSSMVCKILQILPV